MAHELLCIASAIVEVPDPRMKNWTLDSLLLAWLVTLISFEHCESIILLEYLTKFYIDKSRSASL